MDPHHGVDTGIIFYFCGMSCESAPPPRLSQTFRRFYCVVSDERWCWHLRYTQPYFDIILILDEIHPDIWRGWGWACRFIHHRRADYWPWWMSALTVCECPSSCLRICLTCTQKYSKIIFCSRGYRVECFQPMHFCFPLCILCACYLVFTVYLVVILAHSLLCSQQPVL